MPVRSGRALAKYFTLACVAWIMFSQIFNANSVHYSSGTAVLNKHSWHSMTSYNRAINRGVLRRCRPCWAWCLPALPPSPSRAKSTRRSRPAPSPPPSPFPSSLLLVPVLALSTALPTAWCPPIPALGRCVRFVSQAAPPPPPVTTPPPTPPPPPAIVVVRDPLFTPFPLAIDVVVHVPTVYPTQGSEVES